MTSFTTTEQEQQQKPTYSNADYEFANEIIDMIKHGQRLPLKLTADDVFMAMKNLAPWWYQHYPDATQDDQLTFSCDVLKNPQKYLDKAGIDKSFRLHTNQVLMPLDVEGIYEMFYCYGAYANRSLLNYASWCSNMLLMISGYGTWNSVNVDNYMGSVYCLNLLQSMSKQPVAHKFNQHSHILQVFDFDSRISYNAISAMVSRRLPIDSFYAFGYFRNAVMSYVLTARADQVELFGTQLPGDLQFNASVLRTRADKLLDEVKEYIKEAEEANDFYVIKS